MVGQIGITLDGLGVFGAFEGFAVDGFRVGGVLMTGQGVGFLLLGLFIVGQIVGTALSVLIAATPARNRNQRGAACFMLLDCRCDVDSGRVDSVWS